MALCRQDAIFYCDALPQCTVTCQGPDKELLKVVTEQCGCMLEVGGESRRSESVKPCGYI